jgi:ATP-dependent Clp protease adaptor protein ClpS
MKLGLNPLPLKELPVDTESETIVTTKPKTRETQQTKRIPPYNVILENDDHHSFEFVIGVLQKALGYKLERAVELTVQAHKTGRAVVWTGPKEVAELKCEQVRTFHEIREPEARNLGPVGCTIEPAPGG